VTSSTSLPEHAALRRRSAIIAGHVADAATALGLLNDDEPKVRASALSALARCDKLTTAQLAAAAADPSVIARRRAATLTGTAPVATTAIVLSLLGDEDSSVVEIACWAAGERPADDATIDRLMEIGANDEDPLCRESAIAALGSLEAERALSVIIGGCSDKPAIRRRSVLALAPFDNPEVRAVLTRALEDRDWQVRQAAEDLL